MPSPTGDMATVNELQKHLSHATDVAAVDEAFFFSQLLLA